MINLNPNISGNLMQNNGELKCFNNSGQCDFFNMLAMMMQNKSISENFSGINNVSDNKKASSNLTEHVYENLQPVANLKIYKDLDISLNNISNYDNEEDFNTNTIDNYLLSILGAVSNNLKISSNILEYPQEKYPNNLETISIEYTKPFSRTKFSGENLNPNVISVQDDSQYSLLIYNSPEVNIKLGSPAENNLNVTRNNVHMLNTIDYNSSDELRVSHSFMNEDSLKGFVKSKNSIEEEPVINTNLHLDSYNTLIDDKNKIIQVSDESAKINSNLLSQIEDKIVFMSKGEEGIHEITMELYPKNLGKVNIRMSIEAEKVTVELSAINEETNKVLMSNIQELTNALIDTAKRDVSVSMASYNFNYNQQGDLNYNQQNGRERNGRSYFPDETLEENPGESTIIELINLKNEKLNRIV